MLISTSCGPPPLLLSHPPRLFCLPAPFSLLLWSSVRLVKRFYFRRWLLFLCRAFLTDTEYIGGRVLCGRASGAFDVAARPPLWRTTSEGPVTIIIDDGRHRSFAGPPTHDDSSWVHCSPPPRHPPIFLSPPPYLPPLSVATAHYRHSHSCKQRKGRCGNGIGE